MVSKVYKRRQLCKKYYNKNARSLKQNRKRRYSENRNNEICKKRAKIEGKNKEVNKEQSIKKRQSGHESFYNEHPIPPKKKRRISYSNNANIEPNQNNLVCKRTINAFKTQESNKKDSYPLKGKKRTQVKNVKTNVSTKIRKSPYCQRKKGNISVNRINRIGLPAFRRRRHKKRKKLPSIRSSEKVAYNSTVLNNSFEKEISVKLSEALQKINPGKTIEEASDDVRTILKWCNVYRSEKVHLLKKTIKGIKKKTDTVLSSWNESIKNNNSEKDNFVSLLGHSEHTVFSEPYFYDTSYNTLSTSHQEPLEINVSGTVMNLFPLSNYKEPILKWKCNPNMCKINDERELERFRLLLDSISKTPLICYQELIFSLDVCSCNKTSDKRGHLYGESNCPSTFLFLRRLAPHFPLIRRLLHLLYVIKKVVTELNELNTSLLNADIEMLKNVEAKMKCSGKEFEVHVEGYKNEDEITERFPKAFKKHRDRSRNTPSIPCISCERLCLKTDVVNIDRIKKPITNSIWENLIAETSFKGILSKDICCYCLGKFRNNELPATCVLNHMHSEVPDCIKVLNDFEKMIIQRAKAFQVVVRMNAVSKKYRPNTSMAEKVIGRTFHLPLPTQQTLNKLPHPSDAIIPNQELFVLIRGLPTKQKKIWQSMVSVDKVYNALTWLKDNNPLYQDIDLTCAKKDIETAGDNMVEVEDCGETNSFDNIEHGKQLEDEREIPLEKNVLRESVGNAMLTQKNPDDCFYDQYTIHTLNEGRINKTSTELYQMLKIEDVCVPYGDHELDVKCFPDLFPRGINGQFSNRPKSIKPTEFIKSRLMSSHPQYRNNKQYLFFLLHDSNIRALRAGIYHKLNIVNCNEKLSSSKCLELLKNDELERNLTTIFARLRNTYQYWMKPRSDLTCMIMWYGPVTFFLTLSPSEYNWDDLAEYIIKVNPDIEGKKSISSLVAMDPVSASRFIDIQFKAMLDFISSEDCPLGRVIHYAWRREYQTRGLQHFHLLLWVEDAPVIGKSTSEDISDFISTYISCKQFDKTKFPTLAERIENYQTHRHNSYCMRTKKTKKGFTRRCRFGFPRTITEKLVLNDVAYSIAGKRTLSNKRLYDLPRKTSETMINDYNPSVLMAWNGNVDIQFIGEKSCALSSYVTKYQTKAEKSNDQDIFHSVNSTKSLQQKLWNIALRSLNNRECGSLEASDTLLSLPLFGTDPGTIIKWVDVGMVRNRKLKTKTELESLNNDSTDIFCPSMLDTHYPSRPTELEDTCLFDFTSKYDIVKVQPKSGIFYTYDGVGFIKQRKNECLVKHRIYSPMQEPEKYFYGMLLLFKPWRSTADLKMSDECYASAFLSYKDRMPGAIEHHNRIQALKTNQEELETMVKNILNNPQEHEETSRQVHQPNIGDIETIMDELKVATDEISMDIDSSVKKLNNDQLRVFNEVTCQLKNFVNNSSFKPLRHFVSGVGGTGKSFLIQVIRHWVKYELNKNVVVTAPTGIAAYNINGMTIHRILQLPVEHGKVPVYKPLSDDIIKIIRQNMKDVVLLIIDETSMISNILLMYINHRLCEIFNTADMDDGWFGKINILLFGDLLQLPPVMEDSPFVHLCPQQCEKFIRSAISINLWQELFTYDELIINMRQKEDENYAAILSRIRIGTVVNSDIDVLNTRKIVLNAPSNTGKLNELANIILQMPPETVTLCATRSQCKTINDILLENIKTDEVKLDALDSLDCPDKLKMRVTKKLTALNNDSSRTAGLEKEILVKKNCKVMLLRNIDVSHGLVNGSVGIVKDFTKDDHDTIETIIITFKERDVEIQRSSTKFEVIPGAFVFRKQFPIAVAYAITIHKSQGLTLNSCIVDASNSVFSCGQTYVALSRVTSLTGLLILNFDPQNVKAQASAIAEYNRLRIEYRPELKPLQIGIKSQEKIPDQIWQIHNNKLGAVQDITNNIDELRSPGFKNVDGVSCYANAILQCILNCPPIVTSIKNYGNNSLLKEMVISYQRNEQILNSIDIRNQLGPPFNTNEQQDCAEFLNCLISNHQPLEFQFRHSIELTTKCSNCNHSTTSYDNNFIYQIFIPNHLKRKASFDDLLNSQLNAWFPIADSTCTTCQNGHYIQKTSISVTNNFIIFQLQLWQTHDSKITSLIIPGLQNTKIKINGILYKLKTAVFHLGNSTVSGHYIAYIQNKYKWIEANDEQVNVKKWPYGAKNVYIIIFQKNR